MRFLIAFYIRRTYLHLTTKGHLILFQENHLLRVRKVSGLDAIEIDTGG